MRYQSKKVVEICTTEPVIGCWYGPPALEVHKIEEADNGEIYYYCVYNPGSENRTYHKVQVYYYEPRDFIKLGNLKFYTDECLRV